MDTTETYIKMCDCQEVRDIIDAIIEADHQRKIETHKRFRDTQYSVRIPDMRTPDVMVFDNDNKPRRQINLLSQDQIQMIMMRDYKNTLEMLCDFYAVVTIDQPMGFEKMFDASWEQHWIVFYMWKKHTKVWKNERWTDK